MPRPRRDGTPTRPVSKVKLTPLHVEKLKPQATAFLTWDLKQGGLALSTLPSGHKAWKCIFRFHGRPRWLHIGDARAIGLSDARKIAAEHMLAVARGIDPAANKQAEQFSGTFKELAEKYVNDFAKVKNKSWRQAAALVEKHLTPYWAKLRPADITRSDCKAVLARITAPVVRNQVLASGSAIFSWAIREEVAGLKDNPFKLIERHQTRSRERILSDGEIPTFWAAFTDAGSAGTILKLILLLGQRPGEVIHMRREHIVDGWWTMPGETVPTLGWPGTKNAKSHRLWISTPAQQLIAEADGEGFVFAGRHGRPIANLDDVMRAVCSKLGVSDKVTPHDLRRTFSSKVTALGFGRDGMNRVTNHKEGGIADVYDRHRYAEENQKIMESVGSHIVALATGDSTGNVLTFQRK